MKMETINFDCLDQYESMHSLEQVLQYCSDSSALDLEPSHNKEANCLYLWVVVFADEEMVSLVSGEEETYC